MYPWPIECVIPYMVLGRLSLGFWCDFYKFLSFHLYIGFEVVLNLVLLFYLFTLGAFDCDCGCGSLGVVVVVLFLCILVSTVVCFCLLNCRSVQGVLGSGGG